MVQARKNPVNGRYVLYVGDSRGLAYYIAGVDGVVDLFVRSVGEFQAKYTEDHPEHLRDVVDQLRTKLPEGWVISAKAGAQLAWIQKILNRNPKSQGEITMSEKKNQPKLSAGKKPAATPAKAEKPVTEKPVTEKPQTKSLKAHREEAAAAEEGKGRKNPYAGLKIKVLSKDIAAREGSTRQVVLSEIIGAKTVDEVYGVQLDIDGKVTTINTAWLNFAKNAGLVDFV